MEIDNQIGVYDKYTVTRNDGDPTGKHANCAYFVLDTDHDPFAIPALKAYAAACEEEYPQLAVDILYRIDRLERLKDGD